MTSPNIVEEVRRSFARFFRTEVLGGTVLLLATIVALAWANLPWGTTYDRVWMAELPVLSKPVVFVVNDIFMSIFFLVVGLEIKRELAIGELSSPRKAALPAIAALGGMLVPAAIFLAITPSGPASRGWGVPMATDIAFALGCLRVLGSRVPAGLIVFLTALAIIDDLGAILVIAVFYASTLSVPWLLSAVGFALALIATNMSGVRRPLVYLALGVPLWISVLKGGVHPTIAGVIVGLCVPVRGSAETEDDSSSPSSRIEHALHPWVAYGVIPIFALANAGVQFGELSWRHLVAPVSLGSMAGLFLGKQLGIVGASWLCVRTGLAELPAGVTPRHLYGMSLLAGIGFTMALFIAALAFGEGTPHHQQAKVGIFLGSLVSAVVGLVVLSRRTPSVA